MKLRLARFQRRFFSSTHYEVLGLNRDASLADIKAAYHLKVKESHPDMNTKNSSEEFLLIRKAFKVLSDEKQKMFYDTQFESVREMKKEPRMTDTTRQDDSSQYETEPAFTNTQYRSLLKNRVPRSDKDRKSKKEERKLPVINLYTMVFKGGILVLPFIAVIPFL